MKQVKTLIANIPDIYYHSPNKFDRDTQEIIQQFDKKNYDLESCIDTAIGKNLIYRTLTFVPIQKPTKKVLT